MAEIRKKSQLNMAQKDRLFYGSLILLALLAFLFAGSGEPVLFDDSGAYIRIRRVEGVMPLYPLFLLINQYLFGLERYLSAVVAEQGILAAGCVIFFVKTVRDEFHLRYWETYLVFFLSLMPFTTDMPQSMATQQILTEGLSYALFYLFVTILLRTVWTKKYTWFAGSLAMVFVLSTLRSQLQILFAVCGVIFLYVVCRRKEDGKKVYIWIRTAAGAVGGICICLVGIYTISGVTAGYMDMINTMQLRVVLMSNMAKVYNGMDDYDTAIAIEEEVIKLCKENKLCNVLQNAYGELAWSILSQIKEQGRDKKDLELCKKYLRQGYAIAVISENYFTGNHIKKLYEDEFKKNI